MNVKDRQKIDFYCDIAVRTINIMNLWPKLIENKIFNIDDVNISTWKKNFDKEETVKNIWLTIKTRGPSAFQNLLLSLRQSNHEELADQLDEHTKNSFEFNNDNYFSEILSTEKHLWINVKKSDKFANSPYDLIKCYQMTSNPRGLVLIITNIDYKSDLEKPRTSAIHDQINLFHLFHQMGFSIEKHCDLTGQEIKDCVKSFSKREELQYVDSCFIIVSSHGSGPGRKGEEYCTEIKGVDDDYMDHMSHEHTKVFCSDIIECFTSTACPYLAGKPKVFIFQLCRGTKTQTTTIRKTMPKRVTDSSQYYVPKNNSDSSSKNEGTRNYSDMLIAYATLPGHVAFRNAVTGSWFILIFCEVFMNHACEHHICDLFKIVDSRLRKVTSTENYCQTVSVECKGFYKHCYINPGIFEEKEEK
ncbi:PREDICTED: caspase-2-like [Polistes dominula]|uniref:Caspase-2-like n=1 Tax=Polistes dominula TaxID=743375 RepID=A0ABM1J9Z9_POLDO|nr:PREDICTED: caspase-2-like [Polistes dominula]